MAEPGLDPLQAERLRMRLSRPNPTIRVSWPAEPGELLDDYVVVPETEARVEEIPVSAEAAVAIEDRYGTEPLTPEQATEIFADLTTPGQRMRRQVEEMPAEERENLAAAGPKGTGIEFPADPERRRELKALVVYGEVERGRREDISEAASILAESILAQSEIADVADAFPEMRTIVPVPPSVEAPGRGWDAPRREASAWRRAFGYPTGTDVEPGPPEGIEERPVSPSDYTGQTLETVQESQRMYYELRDAVAEDLWNESDRTREEAQADADTALRRFRVAGNADAVTDLILDAHEADGTEEDTPVYRALRILGRSHLPVVGGQDPLAHRREVTAELAGKNILAVAEGLRPSRQAMRELEQSFGALTIADWQGVHRRMSVGVIQREMDRLEAEQNRLQTERDAGQLDDDEAQRQLAELDADIERRRIQRERTLNPRQAATSLLVGEALREAVEAATTSARTLALFTNKAIDSFQELTAGQQIAAAVTLGPTVVGFGAAALEEAETVGAISAKDAIWGHLLPVAKYLAFPYLAEAPTAPMGMEGFRWSRGLRHPGKDELRAEAMEELGRALQWVPWKEAMLSGRQIQQRTDEGAAERATRRLEIEARLDTDPDDAEAMEALAALEYDEERAQALLAAGTPRPWAHRPVGPGPYIPRGAPRVLVETLALFEDMSLIGREITDPLFIARSEKAQGEIEQTRLRYQDAVRQRAMLRRLLSQDPEDAAVQEQLAGLNEELDALRRTIRVQGTFLTPEEARRITEIRTAGKRRDHTFEPIVPMILAAGSLEDVEQQVNELTYGQLPASARRAVDDPTVTWVVAGGRVGPELRDQLEAHDIDLSTWRDVPMKDLPEEVRQQLYSLESLRRGVYERQAAWSMTGGDAAEWIQHTFATMSGWEDKPPEGVVRTLRQSTAGYLMNTWAALATELILEQELGVIDIPVAGWLLEAAADAAQRLAEDPNSSIGMDGGAWLLTAMRDARIPTTAGIDYMFQAESPAAASLRGWLGVHNYTGIRDFDRGGAWARIGANLQVEPPGAWGGITEIMRSAGYDERTKAYQAASFIGLSLDFLAPWEKAAFGPPVGLAARGIRARQVAHVLPPGARSDAALAGLSPTAYRINEQRRRARFIEAVELTPEQEAVRVTDQEARAATEARVQEAKGWRRRTAERIREAPAKLKARAERGLVGVEAAPWAEAGEMLRAEGLIDDDLSSALTHIGNRWFQRDLQQGTNAYRNLPSSIQEQVKEVLRNLGVDPEAVAAQVDEQARARFAETLIGAQRILRRKTPADQALRASPGYARARSSLEEAAAKGRISDEGVDEAMGLYEAMANQWASEEVGRTTIGFFDDLEIKVSDKSPTVVAEGVLGQGAPVPTFYSTVERAVQAPKGPFRGTASVAEIAAGATAGRVKATTVLRDLLSNRTEAKAEEVRAIGLDEWLEERSQQGDGKVSRQEVLDWSHEHQFALEMHVYGGSPELIQLAKDLSALGNAERLAARNQIRAAAPLNHHLEEAGLGHVEIRNGHQWYLYNTDGSLYPMHPMAVHKRWLLGVGTDIAARMLVERWAELNDTPVDFDAVLARAEAGEGSVGTIDQIVGAVLDVEKYIEETSNLSVEREILERQIQAIKDDPEYKPGRYGPEGMDIFAKGVVPGTHREHLFVIPPESYRGPVSDRWSTPAASRENMILVGYDADNIPVDPMSAAAVSFQYFHPYRAHGMSFMAPPEPHPTIADAWSDFVSVEDRGRRRRGDARRLAGFQQTLDELGAGKPYTDKHWDGQHPGQVVHFISSIFKDPVTGQRILLLEEVQSDYAQDLRKARKASYRAYSTEKKSLGWTEEKIRTEWKSKARVTESRAEAEAALTDMRDAARANLETRWRLPDESIEAYEARTGPEGTEPAGLLVTPREIGELAEARSARFEEAVDGQPDYPFQERWHQLALNQVIRLAAEEDLAGIAWLTGEQTAERYNLKWHDIRQVEWVPEDISRWDGGGHLFITTMDGSRRSLRRFDTFSELSTHLDETQYKLLEERGKAFEAWKRDKERGAIVREAETSELRGQYEDTFGEAPDDLWGLPGERWAGFSDSRKAGYHRTGLGSAWRLSRDELSALLYVALRDKMGVDLDTGVRPQWKRQILPGTWVNTPGPGSGRVLRGIVEQHIIPKGWDDSFDSTLALVLEWFDKNVHSILDEDGNIRSFTPAEVRAIASDMGLPQTLPDVDVPSGDVDPWVSIDQVITEGVLRDFAHKYDPEAIIRDAVDDLEGGWVIEDADGVDRPPKIHRTEAAAIRARDINTRADMELGEEAPIAFQSDDPMSISSTKYGQFYDKTIRGHLDKAGKRYGARVTKKTFHIGLNKNTPIMDHDLHYLEMTPGLRQKALGEGFPLFKTRDAQVLGSFQNVREVAKPGTPLQVRTWAQGVFEELVLADEAKLQAMSLPRLRKRVQRVGLKLLVEPADLSAMSKAELVGEARRLVVEAIDTHKRVPGTWTAVPETLGKNSKSTAVNKAMKDYTAIEQAAMNRPLALDRVDRLARKHGVVLEKLTTSKSWTMKKVEDPDADADDPKKKKSVPIAYAIRDIREGTPDFYTEDGVVVKAETEAELAELRARLHAENPPPPPPPVKKGEKPKTVPKTMFAVQTAPRDFTQLDTQGLLRLARDVLFQSMRVEHYSNVPDPLTTAPAAGSRRGAVAQWNKRKRTTGKADLADLMKRLRVKENDALMLRAKAETKNAGRTVASLSDAEATTVAEMLATSARGSVSNSKSGRYVPAETTRKNGAVSIKVMDQILLDAAPGRRSKAGEMDTFWFDLTGGSSSLKPKAWIITAWVDRYGMPEGITDMPTNAKTREPFVLAVMEGIEAQRAKEVAAWNKAGRPTNALTSPAVWKRAMERAFGAERPFVEPSRAARLIEHPELIAEIHRGLTKGQRRDAATGAALAQDFKQLYADDGMTVTDTAHLFLWGILSRRLSPFPHEAAFIDAVVGRIDEYIEGATRGEFDLDDYLAYIETIKVDMKKFGSPGIMAIANLRDYGRFFLEKTKAFMPDTNKTYLTHLHEMMSDTNLSGRDVRRRYFTEMPEKLGINAKVLSFILLVTGRDDVIVLDRVQIKHMWDGARRASEFGTTNMYEFWSKQPYSIDKGVDTFGPWTGSTGPGQFIADVRGLVIYELLEAGLRDSVREGHEQAGVSGATLGQFHWESWVAISNQEVSHGTLEGQLRAARKQPDPWTGTTVKEGKFTRRSSGFQYFVEADGSRSMMVPMMTGEHVVMSAKAIVAYLGTLEKITDKAKASHGFTLSESIDRPWFEQDAIEAYGGRQAIDDAARALVDDPAYQARIVSHQEALELTRRADGSGLRADGGVAKAPRLPKGEWDAIREPLVDIHDVELATEVLAGTPEGMGFVVELGLRQRLERGDLTDNQTIRLARVFAMSEASPSFKTWFQRHSQLADREPNDVTSWDLTLAELLAVRESQAWFEPPEGWTIEQDAGSQLWFARDEQGVVVPITERPLAGSVRDGEGWSARHEAVENAAVVALERGLLGDRPISGRDKSSIRQGAVLIGQTPEEVRLAIATQPFEHLVVFEDGVQVYRKLGEEALVRVRRDMFLKMAHETTGTLVAIHNHPGFGGRTVLSAADIGMAATFNLDVVEAVSASGHYARIRVPKNLWRDLGLTTAEGLDTPNLATFRQAMNAVEKASLKDHKHRANVFWGSQKIADDMRGTVPDVDLFCDIFEENQRAKLRLQSSRIRIESGYYDLGDGRRRLAGQGVQPEEASVLRERRVAEGRPEGTEADRTPATLAPGGRAEVEQSIRDILDVEDVNVVELHAQAIRPEVSPDVGRITARILRLMNSKDPDVQAQGAHLIEMLRGTDVFEAIEEGRKLGDLLVSGDAALYNQGLEMMRAAARASADGDAASGSVFVWALNRVVDDLGFERIILDEFGRSYQTLSQTVSFAAALDPESKAAVQYMFAENAERLGRRIAGAWWQRAYVPLHPALLSAMLLQISEILEGNVKAGTPAEIQAVGDRLIEQRVGDDAWLALRIEDGRLGIQIVEVVDEGKRTERPPTESELAFALPLLAPVFPHLDLSMLIDREGDSSFGTMAIDAMHPGIEDLRRGESLEDSLARAPKRPVRSYVAAIPAAGMPDPHGLEDLPAVWKDLLEKDDPDLTIVDAAYRAYLNHHLDTAMADLDVTLAEGAGVWMTDPLEPNTLVMSAADHETVRARLASASKEMNQGGLLVRSFLEYVDDVDLTDIDEALKKLVKDDAGTERVATAFIDLPIELTGNVATAIGEAFAEGLNGGSMQYGFGVVREVQGRVRLEIVHTTEWGASPAREHLGKIRLFLESIKTAIGLDEPLPVKFRHEHVTVDGASDYDAILQRHPEAARVAYEVPPSPWPERYTHALRTRELGDVQQGAERALDRGVEEGVGLVRDDEGARRLGVREGEAVAAAEVAGLAGEVERGVLPERRFRVESSVRGDEYHTSIIEHARTHKFGLAVDIKSPEFYRDPANKLYLSDDGTAGVAVTADYDLVSVFKRVGSTANIREMLAEAAPQAVTLDAYDIKGFLPSLYAEFDFKPVARVPFDTQYMPDGWDLDVLNHPDVLMMVRDPEGRLPAADDYNAVRDSVPVFDDYDEALAARHRVVAELYGDDIRPEAERAERAVAPPEPEVRAPRDEQAQWQIEGDAEGLVEITSAEMRAALKDDPNIEAGLTFRVEDDVLRVVTADLPEAMRGRGIGQQMYLRAIKQAQDLGVKFESDAGPSPDAVAVYESLIERGVPLQTRLVEVAGENVRQYFIDDLTDVALGVAPTEAAAVPEAVARAPRRPQIIPTDTWDIPERKPLPEVEVPVFKAVEEIDELDFGMMEAEPVEAVEAVEPSGVAPRNIRELTTLAGEEKTRALREEARERARMMPDGKGLDAETLWYQINALAEEDGTIRLRKVTEWLRDHAESDITRALADQVAELIGEEETLLFYDDAVPPEKMSSTLNEALNEALRTHQPVHGLYDAGSKQTLIVANDGRGDAYWKHGIIGTHGVNEPTIVHEILHAALHRAIVDSDPPKGRAYLLTQFDTLHRHISRGIDKIIATRGRGDARLYQAAFTARSKFGMTSSVDELISWAMTDTNDASYLLHRIRFRRSRHAKTPMRRFVELVRDLLVPSWGRRKFQVNALERTLVLADRLILDVRKTMGKETLPESEAVLRSAGVEGPEAAYRSSLRDIESRLDQARLRGWLDDLYDGDAEALDAAIADEADRIEHVRDYLREVHGITVRQDGLIEFDRLNDEVAALIGDRDVVMFHHTSTAVSGAVRTEGLRGGAVTAKTPGVYLTTEISGPAASQYQTGAISAHGGKGVVYEVRVKLSELMPDPDDADLSWAVGRQFMMENIPAERIIDFGDVDLLYARRAGRVIGSFDGRRMNKIITLFRRADIGTVWHETGHLLEAISSPEDYALYTRHFDSRNSELTLRGQEQLADAFEWYVRTELLPSADMRGPFRRLFAAMQQWWFNMRSTIKPKPAIKLHWDAIFRPDRVAMDEARFTAPERAVPAEAMVTIGAEAIARTTPERIVEPLDPRRAEKAGVKVERRFRAEEEAVDVRRASMMQAMRLEPGEEVSAGELMARVVGHVYGERGRAMFGEAQLVRMTVRTIVPAGRVSRITKEVSAIVEASVGLTPEELASNVGADGVLDLTLPQQAGLRQLAEELANEAMGQIIPDWMVSSRPEDLAKWSRLSLAEYNALVEVAVDTRAGVGARRSRAAEGVPPTVGYAVLSAITAIPDWAARSLGVRKAKSLKQSYLDHMTTIAPAKDVIDPGVSEIVDGALRELAQAQSDIYKWSQMAVTKNPDAGIRSMLIGLKGLLTPPVRHIDVDALPGLQETLNSSASAIIDSTFLARLTAVLEADGGSVIYTDAERTAMATLRRFAMDPRRSFQPRGDEPKLLKTQGDLFGRAVSTIREGLQLRQKLVTQRARILAKALVGRDADLSKVTKEQWNDLYVLFYSGRWSSLEVPVRPATKGKAYSMASWAEDRGLSAGYEAGRLTGIDPNTALLEMIVRLRAEEILNRLGERLAVYGLTTKTNMPDIDAPAGKFITLVSGYINRELSGGLVEVVDETGQVLEEHGLPAIENVDEVMAYREAVRLLSEWGFNRSRIDEASWVTVQFPDGSESLVPPVVKKQIDEALDRVGTVGVAGAQVMETGRLGTPELRKDRTPGERARMTVGDAVNKLWIAFPLTGSLIQMGVTVGVGIVNTAYFASNFFGAAIQVYQGIGFGRTLSVGFRHPVMTAQVVKRLWRQERGGAGPAPRTPEAYGRKWVLSPAAELWTKGRKRLGERFGWQGDSAPVRLASIVTKDGRIYTADMIATIAEREGLSSSYIKAETAQSLAADIASLHRPFWRHMMATPSWWQSTLTETATAMDNYWRVGTLIEGLKRGESPAAAAQMARDVGYDYSALTDWEKKYCRFTIMFYSYMKRNQVHFWDTLLRNPHRVLGQLRLARGVMREHLEDSEIIVPEYYASRFVLRFREATVNTHQQQAVGYLAPPLPIADAYLLWAELYDLGTAAILSRRIDEEALGETLSRVTPWVQFIPAMKFEEDLFYSRRLTAFQDVPPEYIALDLNLTGGFFTYSVFDVRPVLEEDPARWYTHGDDAVYTARNAKAWWIFRNLGAAVPFGGRNIDTMDALFRSNPGGLPGMALDSSRWMREQGYTLAPADLQPRRPEFSRLLARTGGEVMEPRYGITRAEEFLRLFGARPVFYPTPAFARERFEEQAQREITEEQRRIE